LVRDPSTVVWVLKDFSLKRKAVVTRTPDKTIKTYKETPGPVYGYFPASDSYPLVLFEDPWSAALGALDGLDSVALCGATVTRGMALIIADHLKRIDAMGRLVVVVPDPDKAGTEGAAQSVARLEALGLRAARFPVAVDYKDLDPRTRASYAKTIQSLPLPRADGNVL
jgi:hypothetical protein